MTTTHTPMPTTRSEVDQQRANEQLRQAILDKKQAQIEAWSAQIEQMQQSLQSVAEGVRGETEKRLAELRQARDQARVQLENLQQATQDTWDSLLQQSDSFFQDLARRFHEFVSKQS
jgi:predicted  nucleic acid-binding Zn-ribbon protein